MKKLMILAVIALCFAFAQPTFALNVNKLNEAMCQYAAVSEWLNMVMHPGMPKPWTNPMLPKKYEELAAAQKTISAEVTSVETEAEIASIQAVVDSFKKLDGTYDDVGYQVEMLLKERVKFLQLHQ